jgi:hypothetical protein
MLAPFSDKAILGAIMKFLFTMTIFLTTFISSLGFSITPSCTELASNQLTESLNAAKRELHRATERCLNYPHVDAKQSCVNAAFAVYEKQSENAQATFQAQTEACSHL